MKKILYLLQDSIGNRSKRPYTATSLDVDAVEQVKIYNFSGNLPISKPNIPNESGGRPNRI